jgi:hypothetical protein
LASIILGKQAGENETHKIFALKLAAGDYRLYKANKVHIKGKK